MEFLTMALTMVTGMLFCGVIAAVFADKREKKGERDERHDAG